MQDPLSSVPLSTTDIAEAVTILNDQAKINALIAPYTTSQVTSAVTTSQISDFTLFPKLLNISSISYASPFTTVGIKYPATLTCNWQAFLSTLPLQTKDAIFNCSTAGVNASTMCGSFSINTNTTSVSLQTGTLPQGTYNYHFYCVNNVPLSNQFILTSYGPISYTNVVIPVNSSSSSASTTNSTTPTSTSYIMMNILMLLALLFFLF